ncbi:MAG TPA: Holliday junction resolvase RuvX [Pseudomonadales bacterium]|nr:Holliday junction resolvase RuvX [Pseudomonadales bacterium]
MSVTPTVLAFDFGLRNIGVATGQTITRTATALATLRARDGVPDWTAVAALIDEWRPGVLLVGLPLNMDDTKSEMSERAERFAKQLARRFDRAVELVDERLTSFEARGLSRDIDAQHAIAARLIAETYLNAAPPR